MASSISGAIDVFFAFGLLELDPGCPLAAGGGTGTWDAGCGDMGIVGSVAVDALGSPSPDFFFFFLFRFFFCT